MVLILWNGSSRGANIYNYGIYIFSLRKWTDLVRHHCWWSGVFPSNFLLLTERCVRLDRFLVLLCWLGTWYVTGQHIWRKKKCFTINQKVNFHYFARILSYLTVEILLYIRGINQQGIVQTCWIKIGDSLIHELRTQK